MIGRRKKKGTRMLQQGTLTVWEAAPVPPFTVQRYSGLITQDLSKTYRCRDLAEAVRTAWEWAYPYQANIIVEVVDSRDSIVFAHDGRVQVMQEFGPDGIWYGTQLAWDELRDLREDDPLVLFLEQKARTSTRMVVPS